MDDKINNNQEYLLFTSSNFPYGGAGAAFLNLFCKGMVAHSRPVKVYLTRGFAFKSNEDRILRKNKTSDGIYYSYLGLTKRPRKDIFKPVDNILSFFHLLFFLPSIGWKKKRTIIFVYQIDFFQSMLLYLTKKLFGIRIITFVPEYFNKANFQGLVNKIQYYTFIFTLKYLNPLSDGLIVFSHFLKDIYLNKGVKEGKIFVQPNLTDFEFWNAPQITEKYTIGYSGTPGAKDGLGYLFNAISLLKDQMPVSLLVVGDSPFGKSMIPELEIVCENMGIRSLVFFAGLVEYNKVRTYLSQCKMLAITRPNNIQTQAGFPTKLGEYMALKKPVLSTDFGEVERYFTDGDEVVFAKCGDPQSIADKIKWMLQNAEKVNTIAVKGFRKAHELLEYNLSMARIIAYLDEL